MKRQLTLTVEFEINDTCWLAHNESFQGSVPCHFCDEGVIYGRDNQVTACSFCEGTKQAKGWIDNWQLRKAEVTSLVVENDELRYKFLDDPAWISYSVSELHRTKREAKERIKVLKSERNSHD